MKVTPKMPTSLSPVSRYSNVKTPDVLHIQFDFYEQSITLVRKSKVRYNSRFGKVIDFG